MNCEILFKFFLFEKNSLLNFLEKNFEKMFFIQKENFFDNALQPMKRIQKRSFKNNVI